LSIWFRRYIEIFSKGVYEYCYTRVHNSYYEMMKYAELQSEDQGVR
jgi:hypothetical protein